VCVEDDTKTLSCCLKSTFNREQVLFEVCGGGYLCVCVEEDTKVLSCCCLKEYFPQGLGQSFLKF